MKWTQKNEDQFRDMAVQKALGCLDCAGISILEGLQKRRYMVVTTKNERAFWRRQGRVTDKLIKDFKKAIDTPPKK